MLLPSSMNCCVAVVFSGNVVVLSVLLVSGVMWRYCSVCVSGELVNSGSSSSSNNNSNVVVVVVIVVIVVVLQYSIHLYQYYSIPECSCGAVGASSSCCSASRYALSSWKPRLYWLPSPYSDTIVETYLCSSSGSSGI